jgi:AcrR family transcriptional regulator
VPELSPRKLPRQARSRATFEAIVDACARLLRERPLREITTNHIAKRAGVGIGTLYEFFPNRDAVLGVLVEQRLSRLLQTVEVGVAEALALDARGAVDRLVRRLVEAVAAERDLFRVLLREAPALGELESVRRARAAFYEAGRFRVRGSGAVGGSAKLPHPEADSWLISRMLANAVLEIAFLDAERSPRRELLVRELVRLVHRMVYARD